MPVVPLGTLYGERLEGWLRAHGVELCLGRAIRRVRHESGPLVEATDGTTIRAPFVVLAVPWSKLGELVGPEIAREWPWLCGAESLAAAPITGVHLWFDQPITELPHTVLVGRLGQWLFNRGSAASSETDAGHYYQVVISASHELANRDRQAVVEAVHGELVEIWPAAARAKLLRARVITDRAAVFSPRPGSDALRPAQQTSIDGLLVAGDWTKTGWPATMEGAVRSGYLAAEAILRRVGQPQRVVVPDLQRGLLARLLIRKSQ